MTYLDAEPFHSTEKCRETDSDTLLAVYAEASRRYYTCGGHKLAARMERVMQTVERELADRDIPVPTITERLRER